MRERIFGMECEYAPAYHSRDDNRVPQLSGEAFLEYIKELVERLFSSLGRSGYLRAGEFLGNGARLYIDRGGHPEYATPECLSVRDLVAHEIAGDRILQEMASLANRQIADQGHRAALHLYKNNVDLYGHTYGGHENYLITAQAAEGIHAIIPFLVTRQIFTGSGRLLTRHESGGPSYQISQRSEFIQRTYSDRSTQIRGIINTRKREIYRQGQNRRLHVVVGDSNMSQMAIGLKVGTTNLVLRLLEDGQLDGIPPLAYPVKALKSISRSWDSTIQLAGRKGHFSALDVQFLYLEKVHRYFALHPPTEEEKYITELWGEVLDGLKRLKVSEHNRILEDVPAALLGKIDWILKLWLLSRYGDMADLAQNDRRLKLMDLKYHDLDPTTGLHARCEALGLVEHIVDENAVLLARSHPPDNTRARIRGAVIRQTADKNIEVNIENWEKIDIRTQKRKNSSSHPFTQHRGVTQHLAIRLDDPFEALETPIIEQIERFVETWGKRMR